MENTPRTIYKLVYQDEVVLDRFLVNLPKVRFADVDEAVTEFEYQGRVGISSVTCELHSREHIAHALGHRDDIEVVNPYVEEAC